MKKQNTIIAFCLLLISVVVKAQNSVSIPSIAVFTVSYPWSQLVVCDLIIEGAIEYDPGAGQTMVN